MTGTPAAAEVLARRLGADVLTEMVVVRSLMVYRFMRPDVFYRDGERVRFLRVIGSGEDWQTAFEDAVRELERPTLIQQAVEAATRWDV